MRRLETTIREIGWTRDVPQLKPDDLVSVALAAMRDGGHDYVLVVDPARRLIGVFTSRDFLDRVAAAHQDPSRIDMASVMTPDPTALRPRDPVGYALNWMGVEGFRNVPIVDDEGRVLGVLTVWDVMRVLDRLFDELDATPRPSTGADEWIDLGGGT